jgi:hypothetical protein
MIRRELRRIALAVVLVSISYTAYLMAFHD